MEINTVRIIWLSDIHFRKEYALDKTPGKDENKKYRMRLDKYIAGFLEVIGKYNDELRKHKESIDYVLISGDLAFSSAKDDYLLLNEMLIQPLKDRLGNGTKFLTIPGNHDVLRKSDQFFRHFFAQVDSDTPEKIKIDMRRSFLEKKEDYFDLLFIHYSDYFRKHIYPSLSSLPRNDIMASYQENGLYGLVIDKDKNLVFNLINSAWFALGTHFDEILMAEFMRDNFDLVRNNFEKGGTEEILQEKLEKVLRRLVVLKNVIQEYGEQIIGDSIMPTTEILKTLDDHSGSFVITCFHHPTNWMQYATKYDMNAEKNDSLFLNKILKRSAMLLTGHEHVPSSISNERIQKEIVHLKGGMFLQDNMFKDIEGEHRFSILEVDTSRFLFNEKRYSYEWSIEQWRQKEEYSVSKEQIKKRYLKFDLKKEKEWVSKMSRKDTLKNILLHSFMSHKEWGDGILVEINTGVDNVRIFALEHDGKKRRYFLIPLDNSFFNETLVQPVTGKGEHCLDPIVKKMLEPCQSLTLTILTPDFLVNDKLRLQYQTPEIIPMKKTFSDIVCMADFIFNRARHDFFIRFEEDLEKIANFNKLIINGLKFSDVKELNFSNQVIPYWTLERYD